MTIKTVAIAQDSNIVKTSKNKVTVAVDKKSEKSFKFEAVYGNQDGANNVFKHHLTKPITDVLSGHNLNIVGLSSQTSESIICGYQGEPGLVNLSAKFVFSNLEKHSKNEHLVSASMLQITHDGQLIDLINPHSRKIAIHSHSHQGVFVDGLSSFVCSSTEDVVRFYEDGNKASESLHQSKFTTVFTLKVYQRVKGQQEKETSAIIKFVEMSTSQKEKDSVKNVLDAVIQQKNRSAKRETGILGVQDMISDALIGNNNALLVACVDGIDPQEIAGIMSAVENATGLGGSPKANNVSVSMILHQLRQEIDKVRNRLASQNPPNKNDLAHMEKLLGDLEETKRASWDQTILRSELFFQERNTNLSKKGLLWIIESSSPANREKLAKLQKLREKLSKDYKTQRQAVDKVTYELKAHVDNYTQLVHSGKQSDGKQLVSIIQEMKEQLKNETDKLNKVQSQLKDTQEQLQSERQTGVQETSSSFDVAFQAMIEERAKTKQENEQLVEDELRRMKIQVEHEKADIQMKLSSGAAAGNKEVLNNAVELASAKAEKLVMTTQLEAYKREKLQMEEHMRVLAEKHARELEIQELQNLQTFRAYREVFEEYKVELESRWRGLLDDAIQDAVFLNARNNELMQSNASLKREVAELKDSKSLKKGIGITNKV